MPALLEKRIIEKYGYPTADGMVESALHHIQILEDLDFHDIIVCLKASDVNLAIEAYEKAAKAFRLSFSSRHYRIGNPVFRYGEKRSRFGRASSVKGIGNTLRISLSADPSKK